MSVSRGGPLPPADLLEFLHRKRASWQRQSGHPWGQGGPTERRQSLCWTLSGIEAGAVPRWSGGVDGNYQPAECHQTQTTGHPEKQKKDEARGAARGGAGSQEGSWLGFKPAPAECTPGFSHGAHLGRDTEYTHLPRHRDGDGPEIWAADATLLGPFRGLGGKARKASLPRPLPPRRPGKFVISGDETSEHVRRQYVVCAAS